MLGHLSKKQTKNLARIVVCLLAFVVAFSIDKTVGLAPKSIGRLSFLVPLAVYLAIYIAIGYDVIFKAVSNILHGQVFDENFLMLVATLGAFGLAIFKGVTGEELEGFDEACAVLLFYQVGEFFQSYATGRAREDIASMMDIRPDYANLLSEDGVRTVSPEEVNVGDLILISPGERLPLDGVCVEGETALDLKALTGESVPKDVSCGDIVISGAVNLNSDITVRVERAFYDSTVSKILELVENASDKKSKTESFISKFAKYYTPTVVALALLLAIIPGAVSGDWKIWIYRALSFLVVSCPCALVISIPLTFFSGIGAFSKKGILIKGSSFIEQLSKANIFVFDKTGTLTKGNFEVVKIFPQDESDEIIRLAACAENGFSHPIAKSIMREYFNRFDKDPLSLSKTNVAGQGIVASNGEMTVAVGNEKLMREQGVAFTPSQDVGTLVYVAKNGEFVGGILIADAVKDNSKDVISKLKAMGAKSVMLTGDGESVARNVATKLGVDEYKSSLLPQDKVQEVEEMLSQKKKGDVLAYLGDGINDAPVLMRSDIGIAMGGVGSDAAIEAADVVFMKDDLSSLPLSKKLAKKVMTVAYENIVFSLAVKVAILVLSALGITNMWIAVFGDVGVAIIAILNAMRVNLNLNGTKKKG